MDRRMFNETSKWTRIVQHFLFVLASFFVLLNIFKINSKPVAVDFVYTSLFLATILPVVYLNLYWLLPKLQKPKSAIKYFFLLVCAVDIFLTINIELFNHWSAWLFPGYFFISYYTWWELALFFFAFVIITTLLKLSKSRFEVNELQRKLLESEKQRVQSELKALKAQINPHFFFNTLNSIYSMSLEKDERLPGTVLQLSELMRYFLYESKEDTVLLQKEIEVLKDYIALQKIRSDDKLVIDINIEGKITDQKIAPLLLITFLENAFKHGAKGDTKTNVYPPGYENK
ncbi:MAG: histidine kinase [Bacteroidota bacterium]